MSDRILALCSIDKDGHRLAYSTVNDRREPVIMYSHNSAGMAKRTGERSGDFDSGIFWVTLSLAEYDKSTGPLDSEGNRDSNYGGTEVRCSCHREFDLDLDSMVTLFRKGGSPIRISPIAKDQQPKVSARR